jgi:hypothetical protein
MNNNRRDFIRTAAIAGVGTVFSAKALATSAIHPRDVTRAGIIGLDTEHSIAFTKTLNDVNAAEDVSGFRVVAAYPHGSRDIESSVKRIPGYTEEMKKMGVEITGSIGELLKKVDVVFLETNDGRLHLEQAVQVFKARKPMFIDKPVAASLADAVAIFDASEKYKSPFFTASSLRFMANAQDIANGKIGKVLGADAYGPASIEKTHPDLYWYGIHAIEALFTVMGTGCKTVTRFFQDNSEVVVGTWEDNRIGTFRGTREGPYGFGGNAFGEKAIAPIGPWEGYRPLVVKIAEFFRTGKVPVSRQETLEIFAFMQAAEESKERGGVPVTLQSVLQKAKA